MARASMTGDIHSAIMKNKDAFLKQVREDFGSGRNAMKDAIMMYWCARSGTAWAVVKKLEESGVQL